MGGKPAAVDSQEIDFINAKALPLPEPPESVSVAAQQDLITNLVNRYQLSAPAASGHALGSEGNGKTHPVELGAPAVAPETIEQQELEQQQLEQQQFGTTNHHFNHPFSTARADLNVPTNTRYPYRASGRLFFKIGARTFVCSASLIKRGIVVTAAHCVANFGESQFYTGWVFVPGYRSGVAPFGLWRVSTAWVLTTYFTGAARECHIAGVVCKNDVAVLELAPQTSPVFPGTSTGWYGYGFDNWGFTSSHRTHITQTGYPVALDAGQLMERNDSQGYRAASLSGNTIIGSLMTGGSSGGPWLNNFGSKPTLSGTTFGSFSTPNIVVGVTSWGYTSSLPKEQGASPFTSDNIVALVNAACGLPIVDPRCL